MNDNDYAVVIGINKYPSSLLDNLEGPERDACEFKEWLLSPKGGAIPDDGNHIHLILSRDFQFDNDPFLAKPTTLEVDNAFLKIMKQVQDDWPARRLYIFLSGHGISPQSDLDEAALLMANADDLAMGHNIPGRLYAKWFRAAALFQEIVVLMDCCRDNMQHAPPHLPPWNDLVRLDARDVKYLYGFATKWSKKARERKIGHDNEVRGIFSHSLLSVLKSGRLTGSQLRDRVYNHLKQVMGENDYQEPDFDVKPEDGIILSEAAGSAKIPVVISFEAGTIGHTVTIENGDFDDCGTLEASVDPWEIPLEIGKYRIIDKINGKKDTFRVLGGDRIEFKF